MEAVKEIKNILLEKGRVSLPKMGELYVESLSAKVDENLATFTPPTKRIAFTQDVGIEKNQQWSDLVQEWKLILAKENEVKVPTLGTFYYLEDRISFKQEKNFFSDDFFGLEPFPLPKRKLANLQPSPKASTQWVFWVFLLLVPLCALLYLGVTNAQAIFGEKSFPDVSVQTSTHRMNPSVNTAPQQQEQSTVATSKKESITLPVNKTTTTNTKK